jgi:hypothetical protein
MLFNPQIVWYQFVGNGTKRHSKPCNGPRFMSICNSIHDSHKERILQNVCRDAKSVRASPLSFVNIFRGEYCVESTVKSTTIRTNNALA